MKSNIYNNNRYNIGNFSTSLNNYNELIDKRVLHLSIAFVCGIGFASLYNKEFPGYERRLKYRASKGDRESQYLYGKYLMNKDCNSDTKKKQRNISKAFENFQKSSEQDHRTSHYMLGILHLNKLIEEPNPKAAYHHFKIASESDSMTTINKYYHLQSQYELANCMIYGIGCNKNLNDGIILLENIALQGNNNASYKLYSIYNNGKYGVPINKSRALSWLNNAAKLGNKDAINELNNIYLNYGRDALEPTIVDVKKWVGIPVKIRNKDSISNDN